ncbi:MAG TPA: RagB/SusD family nutrient uptake outer membrane protein [Gemmatimonadaceae bacterium]|nr:RagB/SusD family nutrient uptake outer membrane protein [Gemmatimonadaceae bacterium]
MTMHDALRRAAMLVCAGSTLAATAACDLSVTNPGSTRDQDLNTPSAMPALVNGMSGDLSYSLGYLAREGSVMTDELRESGTYPAMGRFDQGIIDDVDAGSLWDNAQEARWVAENGIDRMKQVLQADFETSPLSARAYLYAGFANRVLGENMCDAVIDGGPRQSDSVYFQRADSEFTEALRLAQAQGVDSLALTALAGRAQVRADLGRWTDADADAAQVPADFRFDAIFSTNSERENNNLAYETTTRREVSVWGTQWAATNADPRVPWDTLFTSAGVVQKGNNGSTPFFRQKKYPGVDAPIPLAKGTEMLLIRAEAALRDGAVPAAMGYVNDERAAYGLAALDVSDADSAWTVLQSERGAVLWLETRRLWDLRRWYAEGRTTFLEGRDTCIPISQAEQSSNPNL